MMCKRKSVFKVVGVVALAAFLLVGCSKSHDGGGDNSYTYNGPTVTIGGKTWMAKNLDRATRNSKCYENSADSCVKYGRLYNWNDAKTACPSGWHLPSDAEWDTLMVAVGGVKEKSAVGDTTWGWENASEKLKSKIGWDRGDNGTDDYGFSALPGGFGHAGFLGFYRFYGAGYNGDWWSATEYGASNAWYRDMYCLIEHVFRFNDYKTNLFSVRCVAD